MVATVLETKYKHISVRAYFKAKRKHFSVLKEHICQVILVVGFWTKKPWWPQHLLQKLCTVATMASVESVLAWFKLQSNSQLCQDPLHLPHLQVDDLLTCSLSAHQFHTRSTGPRTACRVGGDWKKWEIHMTCLRLTHITLTCCVSVFYDLSPAACSQKEMSMNIFALQAHKRFTTLIFPGGHLHGPYRFANFPPADSPSPHVKAVVTKEQKSED